MLLHIFLQVICRRVVFALLGRLAGKNSAAFWDTFSVDLPWVVQQFWTTNNSDYCFRQKRCSRVTVDAFCKNEAKHRIKHTSLVQQSANWVLLKYIARNTGIIWRKMRI